MSQTQSQIPVTLTQRVFLERVGLTAVYSVEKSGSRTIHVASLYAPDGQLKLIGKSEDPAQLLTVALDGYENVYGSTPLPRVHVASVETQVETQVETSRSVAFAAEPGDVPASESVEEPTREDSDSDALTPTPLVEAPAPSVEPAEPVAPALSPEVAAMLDGSVELASGEPPEPEPEPAVEAPVVVEETVEDADGDDDAGGDADDDGDGDDGDDVEDVEDDGADADDDDEDEDDDADGDKDKGDKDKDRLAVEPEHESRVFDDAKW